MGTKQETDGKEKEMIKMAFPILLEMKRGVFPKNC